MKKIRFLVLGFIVLILNLIWEFSHYKLYNDLSGISSNIHLIIASFGDLFFIFLIFFFISLINKNIKWLNKPVKSDYLFTIFFGLIIAILIEVINVYFLARWAYKPIMPTIFGIGLSPLLQLATTGILSLFIFKKIN